MNSTVLKWRGKVAFPAILACALTAAASCMPPQTYRTPVSPATSAPSTPRSPQPALPPPPAPAAEPETVRRSLPPEAKIKEQDLKTGSSVSPATKPSSRDAIPGENRNAPDLAAPALRDDSSLLAKITPGTLPQRAASLRLTEEGRKLLDAGDPTRALERFEKTIVIDSTNPYGYFYLAKTHYRLGRYRESLAFLDVAESRLSGEPFWLAEVYALRGENFRALGMTDKAEASYSQSLSLNSGNRTAADALSRVQGETQAAPAPR
jgi:Tetratricopeptide repeat